MKSDSRLVSRLFLRLTGAIAIVFVVACMTGKTTWIAPALAGCFLSLSLAASTGQGILKQLAFTIWIATGVVFGMAFSEWFITFPSEFPWLGGQEMNVVFIPVLQIQQLRQSDIVVAFARAGCGSRRPSEHSEKV